MLKEKKAPMELLWAYLRIQLVVSSNSFGAMMFVSDATEAAQ